MRSETPSLRAALLADDPLFAFRVRAVLILLPLVAVAALGTWALLRSDGEIAVTDLYLLPLIGVVALLGAAWVAFDARRLNAVMFVSLGTVALYELTDLATTFAFELHKSGALGHGAVWFVVVTVTAFIVLPERGAVRFGIVYNLLGVAINIFSFGGGLKNYPLNALLQFHMANWAVLVILWVMAQLRTRYTEVEQLARTDPLTGLLNRRSMQSRLERAGSLYSIVMFDVDYFKRINDQHGHAFGDEVLREIAFTLFNHAPKGSSLARWGGEEFMLLLPGTAAPLAKEYASQLCNAVTRAHPGGDTVTLSAGVAQHRSGDDLERVLQRADEALYRVKETGRNRATLLE